MLKKFRKNKKGSILILTMLALVGALSIAVAMSSISIVERKMTTKSRKSVTAFQSANSGIEWAMKKINDAEPGDSISMIFGMPDISNGEVNCPSNLFSPSVDADCKIVLLRKKADDNNSRVVINTNRPMEDIIAIRSTGTFGSDEEKVGRAIEAYAMPNCGPNEERVADFCIGNVIYDEAMAWGEAVQVCTGANKRLCTANELIAAFDLSGSNWELIGDDEEWASDVTGANNFACVDGHSGDGSDVNTASGSDGKVFRCCRNR